MHSLKKTNAWRPNWRNAPSKCLLFTVWGSKELSVRIARARGRWIARMRTPARQRAPIIVSYLSWKIVSPCHQTTDALGKCPRNTNGRIVILLGNWHLVAFFCTTAGCTTNTTLFAQLHFIMIHPRAARLKIHGQSVRVTARFKHVWGWPWNVTRKPFSLWEVHFLMIPQSNTYCGEYQPSSEVRPLFGSCLCKDECVFKSIQISCVFEL